MSPSAPGLLKLFPSELRERYRPEGVVGSGASGTVYRARDAEGTPVAVKLVQPLPGDAAQRFDREVRALATLQHPHIARYREHGRGPGEGWLVMDLVEGPSLADLPPGLDPLPLLLQVASALDAVHAAGLVHRDLKPENIMLAEGRRAVLVDFGVVFLPDVTRLTQTREQLGSMGFLPPEVLAGGTAGPEADWYAWGVTLFLLREGRLPYSRDTLVDAMLGKPLPVPPTGSTGPEDPVGELLRRCLHRDPARRPRELREVEAILGGRGGPVSAEFVPPRPAPSGSGRRRGALLGLVTLAVAGGLVWSRGGEAPATPSPSPPSEGVPEADPTPPPTEPSAEDGTPFPTGYLQDLRREQEANAEILVGEDWSVVPPGQEALGPVQPLLDSDPFTWGLFLNYSPKLRLFLDWAARGGRPEELPERFRGGLVDLDARYRGHGMLPPFRPYLEGHPATAPVALPEVDLRGTRTPLDFLPDRATGWLGSTYEATERMQAELVRLQGALTEDRDAPERASQRLARLVSVSGKVEIAYRVPARRTAIQDQLRPHFEAARDVLYRGARCLRDAEEAEAEHCAALLDYLLTRERAHWFGAPTFTDRPDPFPPEPTTYPANLAMGSLEWTRLVVREQVGLPRQDHLFQRAMAQWSRILEGPTPTTEAARYRWTKALARQMRAAWKRGRPASAVALYRRHRSGLTGFGELLRNEVELQAAQAYADLEGVAEGERTHVRELAGRLDARLAREDFEPDRKRWQEARVKLVAHGLLPEG
jgi:hypothetical protein